MRLDSHQEIARNNSLAKFRRNYNDEVLLKIFRINIYQFFFSVP